MRYELEVQDYLGLFVLGRPELQYKNGPWLEFQDEHGKRWCQPDALLVTPAKKECVICEVKYQHTADAWYQLVQLYLPVLRCALPGYSFRLLEIVHWFDPQTLWPGELKLVPGLDQVCAGGGDGGEVTSVLIFNRKREHRFQQDGRSSGAGVDQASDPLWPARRSD